MKVYVDADDEGFIYDSFLADNTRLVSEFHHEESELEYSECQLLSLADYTKQVRKEVLADVEKRIVNYCRRQDKKPFQKSIEQIKVDLLTSLNQIQESSTNGQN